MTYKFEITETSLRLTISPNAVTETDNYSVDREGTLVTAYYGHNSGGTSFYIKQNITFAMSNLGRRVKGNKNIDTSLRKTIIGLTQNRAGSISPTKPVARMVKDAVSKLVDGQLASEVTETLTF